MVTVDPTGTCRTTPCVNLGPSGGFYRIPSVSADHATTTVVEKDDVITAALIVVSGVLAKLGGHVLAKASSPYSFFSWGANMLSCKFLGVSFLSSVLDSPFSHFTFTTSLLVIVLQVGRYLPSPVVRGGVTTGGGMGGGEYSDSG